MIVERIGVEAIWQDARFESGIKRYNSAISTAEKNTSAALGNMGNAWGKYEQQAEKSGRGITQALIKSYTDIVNIANTIIGVFREIGQAIEAVFAIAAEGAQQMRAQRAFAQLSGGAEQATENLRVMREATRGAISDQQLMEQASTMLALGVARNSEELGRATRSIVSLGSAMKGLSAERAIQSFVLLTSNFESSKARLDDFGLTVADVQWRVDEYAKSGKDAQEAIRLALLDAVDEKFRQIGGSTEDAAVIFERFQAQTENIGDAFKQRLAPAMAAFVERLIQIDNIKFAETLDRWEQGFLKIAAVAGGMWAAFKQLSETVYQLVYIIQYGLGKSEIFDKVAKGVESIASQLQATLGDLPVVTAYQQAYNETLARGQELAASSRKVNEDLATSYSNMAANSNAAAEAAAKVATELEKYEDRIRALQVRGLEQLVEMSIAADRQIEDSARARARRLEDIERGLAERREQIAQQAATQRARIEQQYSDALQQAQQSYNDAVAQAAQQHARRMEDIERRYQERKRQIEERFSVSFQDAVRKRDALALIEAIRTRQRDLENARRERDQQRTDAEADYNRQIAEQQQALERAREQARIAREQQLSDLQENLRRQEEELNASRAKQLEDMRRAEEREAEDRAIANRRKLEDMQRQFTLERAQAEAAYLGDETAYRAHLERMLQLTQQYIPRIYTMRPTTGGVLPSGRVPGFADGGVMIANTPTLARFGESGPELVIAQPLSGSFTHNVTGAITAQMAGMQGQLTAAVNQAVIEAFRKVMR